MSRTIRVFISSTFRDMQLERDELVKRVFPQVRRMCEQRGVTWGEVDLRWGVTDEQKAEGAVLPICLAEIERTRPYFIGLLGQRYGWVPDEIPATLADQLGWLHDADHELAGRSVTELEILHGVLADPNAPGHAFFYLRDPAWVTSLPSDERATFVEESPDGIRRLAELRALVRRIATHGIVERTGYARSEQRRRFSVSGRLGVALGLSHERVTAERRLVDAIAWIRGGPPQRRFDCLGV
jgi:hypothetical protein